MFSCFWVRPPYQLFIILFIIWFDDSSLFEAGRKLNLWKWQKMPSCLEICDTTSHICEREMKKQSKYRVLCLSIQWIKICAFRINPKMYSTRVILVSIVEAIKIWNFQFSYSGLVFTYQMCLASKKNGHPCSISRSWYFSSPGMNKEKKSISM